MRIVVESTPTAKEQLVKLLEARTPDRGDAVRFAALYTEDIEAQLRKH